MRKPLVIANWKMHGERAFNNTLVTSVLGQLNSEHAECVVCPPYPYLGQVSELLRGSAVGLGAQDCSAADSGAYTGEVAPGMLKDCGCEWVLIGHSERRHYHGESDALVAAKLAAAKRSGLSAVLCVGETQEQRESGDAKRVVTDQLTAALLDNVDLGELVVAYEPVWAIGTGLTASPEQAQEMHAHIRGVLNSISGGAGAGQRLLYGGSVKPGNAALLFAQPDIDGALVGGAALQAKDFVAIVNAA